MSWTRAALVGAVVVGVAFLLLVYVPDVLVSSLSGVGRGTRVAIATGWFTAALATLLWALRKQQARRLNR